MKRIKRLLGIFLALFMLTGCSVVSDYDATILKNASMVTSEFGYKTVDNPFKDSSRFFEVEKTSDNEFRVDVNGTEMIIQIPLNSESEESIPTEITPVSAKYSEILSNSKKLIYQYIDKSTILKDKDGLKEYIDSLNTNEAYFTNDDNVGAYFSHVDSTLYINKNNAAYACEWMIVHEYVHAISYYTHNCSIENEEYAFNLFNEIMTDIITSSLNPNISDEIISVYSIYYSLVYPYIYLVKEDALEAYFYGYNSIYEKIDYDEFRFFVLVIENYGEENSDVYYNNLIMKWYANK